MDSIRRAAGACLWVGILASATIDLRPVLAGEGPGPESPSLRRTTWTETLTAAREKHLRQVPGKDRTPIGLFQPFDSGALPGDGPARRVSVAVAGLRELRLVTTCEEGSANCNIWGEPKLIARNGTETRLTDLRPASVHVGWGSLLVDRNWKDHPLQVGDRSFAFGFWVHAPSEVRFSLEGKFERFEAWIGEDRDRANGAVRFKVLSGDRAEPPPFWNDLAREFPEPSTWLFEDAGLEGLAAWFGERDSSRLEEEIVRRALDGAPAGRAPLLAEADRLREARAPAGDGRWIDLHARCRRWLECSRSIGPIAGAGARSKLKQDLEDLASGKVPFDDPRWRDLRDRAGRTEEIEDQWESLRFDLERRGAFDRIAGETFRPEALILPADRDPTDVVLRRTAALLADLMRSGAAGLADARDALGRLREAADRTPVADPEGRRALFAEACGLRRRIAFSNPLLDFDGILFIRRHRALYDHMCDQFYGMAARPGGGLCILEGAFGPRPRVRDVLMGSVVGKGRLQGKALTGGRGRESRLSFDGEGNLSGEETDGGSFLSPDLSPDGRTILFAYVECAGDRTHRHHTDPARGHWAEGRCYHIFKVGADGSGLEQLTDGTWNDFDPCWLPDGRIAFISERRGGYLRCGRTCPLYDLHDMAADGTGINCLSFHESNEWQPSVAHDGRIVYTRWDYVDRFGCTAHMPWITTLDGRDSRALHGNFSRREARPDMEVDIRAVPGSLKYVATGAPHHGQAFGSLVLIDLGVPDDDRMSPLKRLTPEVGFPETQGGREVYGTAWPLSEDYFLCAYDSHMNRPGSRRHGRGIYGLYLVDSFGNRELIHRDPEIGCLSPIPLRPMPLPAPAPGAVAGEVPSVRPGQGGEATVAVIDVNAGLKPWPAGTRIRELRVLQVLPMSVPSGSPPHETGRRIAEAGDSVVPARWVLGTVPVEEDGSAHFVVPAHREIFFQALDENGLAVQSMRSGTYLREGEVLTCPGCHEPKGRTPAVSGSFPLALRRGPSRLRPDVDGSSPFSYPRLVQPVLDRACVPCHSRDPGKSPNLGREPIVNRWYASYSTLVKHGFTSYGDGYRTTPGRFGARASRLFGMLTAGHHGLELPAEDLHRIALWLDCTSLFYGVYEKEGGEAQLRGEVARPTLE